VVFRGVLQLLMVGGSSEEVAGVIALLARGGHRVRPRCAFNATSFVRLLEQRDFDLVLWLDTGGVFTLETAMSLLRASRRDAPVVVVRSLLSEDDRTEALRVGARDAVSRRKPEHLLLVVEREVRALCERRARRDAEQRQAHAQRAYMELFRTSPSALAYLRAGRHLEANSAYRRLFGYSYLTELRGLPLTKLVSPEDAPRLDEALARLEREAADGSVEVEVAAVGSGGAACNLALVLSRAQLNGMDVVKVVAHDRRRKPLPSPGPRRDALTGLHSHQHFLEVLERAVQAAHAQGEVSTLMLIELEHFRTIRATVGIAAADHVVRDLARVALEIGGGEGLLARFADHTFTLLKPGADLEAARALAERLRRAIEDHISDVRGQSVAITASVGIAVVDAGIGDYQAALTQADMACREAIHAGGNRVETFRRPEPESTAQAASRARGESIREAIAADRLELCLEPILTLHGELTELYRVDVQLGGDGDAAFSHDQLLAAARSTGLARTLDRWLINRAVCCLLEGRELGGQAHFFIRLSDESVKDASLALHLRRLLRKCGLDGARLIFEISEKAATEQVRAARAFAHALHELRCRTALERFAGHPACLRVLKHLDVDFLKIDATCLRNLVGDAQSQSALRHIQETARLMNKATVATSVENVASLAILWQYGVHYVQGDYVQGPVIELGAELAAGGMHIGHEPQGALVH